MIKKEERVKPYRLPLKRRAGDYFRNFTSPFVVIMFLLISLQIFIIIFSLYWMFTTSLKSQVNFGIDPIGLPATVRWDNFSKALKYLFIQVKVDGGYRNAYLPELIQNSLLFAGGHTVMVVATDMIAGYCLAKFTKFRGIRIIRTIILIKIVVPVMVSLSASMDLNKFYGIYDNFPALLYTCIGIFDGDSLIVIGAYAAVHNSYIEAAKIDGASNTRIMFTIAMPLIKTIIAIKCITYFISQWNNYMTPYLYLPSMPTLSIALMNFSQSNTNAISSEPMQMAAAALVCLPCLLLFLSIQHKMVGTMTMGGLKG